MENLYTFAGLGLPWVDRHLYGRDYLGISKPALKQLTAGSMVKKRPVRGKRIVTSLPVSQPALPPLVGADVEEIVEPARAVHQSDNRTDKGAGPSDRPVRLYADGAA